MSFIEFGVLERLRRDSVGGPSDDFLQRNTLAGSFAVKKLPDNSTSPSKQKSSYNEAGIQTETKNIGLPQQHHGPSQPAGDIFVMDSPQRQTYLSDIADGDKDELTAFIQGHFKSQVKEDEIQRIRTILAKNWINDISAFRSLTPTSLALMQLPLGLYDLVENAARAESQKEGKPRSNGGLVEENIIIEMNKATSSEISRRFSGFAPFCCEQQAKDVQRVQAVQEIQGVSLGAPAASVAHSAAAAL